MPAGRGGWRFAFVILDFLVRRMVVLRVVRLLGLGLAWSGGVPAVGFFGNAGPDGWRFLLDFFGGVLSRRL